MAQTKADRSAAAKKAAATRKRNEIRNSSQTAGKKAAGTRQGRDAKDAAARARRQAGRQVGGQPHWRRKARRQALAGQPANPLGEEVRSRDRAARQLRDVRVRIELPDALRERALE